jgi:hypothetical protein
MVAGHHWVVDHKVVRGVTTDRAEIFSFEAVLSYDEVLEPQFKFEHEGPPVTSLRCLLGKRNIHAPGDPKSWQGWLLRLTAKASGSDRDGFRNTSRGFRWKGYQNLGLAQPTEQSQRSLIQSVYEADRHAVEMGEIIVGRANIEAHNLGGQDQGLSIR